MITVSTRYAVPYCCRSTLIKLLNPRVVPVQVVVLLQTQNIARLGSVGYLQNHTQGITREIPYMKLL